MMTFEYFLDELEQSIFAAKSDLPFTNETRTFEEWLKFLIEWSRPEEARASLEPLKIYPYRVEINSEVQSIE